MNMYQVKKVITQITDKIVLWLWDHQIARPLLHTRVKEAICNQTQQIVLSHYGKLGVKDVQHIQIKRPTYQELN